jgi:quercetin dioxygenase-like cupin family protein
MRVPTLILFAFVVPAAACSKEKTGTVVGPPLMAQRASPGDYHPLAMVSAPGSLIQAAFTDDAHREMTVNVHECENILVAPEGHAWLRGPSGEEIAAERGEMVIVGGRAQPGDDYKLRVDAPALFVHIGNSPSCQGLPTGKVTASAAPELTWAKGQMHAHLDVESPRVYVGRLEGTAPVAEHTHATSWEILCAFEAAGTFVLDGKDQRLGAHQLVFVPPNAKHAWRPDPGSKLVAIQLYDPPGPEQRFKKLAADEAAAK